jgi:hypothetical protein
MSSAIIIVWTAVPVFAEAETAAGESAKQMAIKKAMSR